VSGKIDSANSAFNEERYWTDRLEETFSLGGVGWLGLSEPFNRWMYRVRRRLFLRAAARAVSGTPARVLDVGSGTGFYVDLWHALGVAHVTGADLTRVAVDRLGTRYPNDRFLQLDITTGLDGLDTGHFDAVSAMDVLFHVVDDVRYQRAIEHLSQLLAPGGVLLFTENLLHGRSLRAAHQVSRDIDWIGACLEGNGLDVIARRPMFVMMNTPIDSNSSFLHCWWAVLSSTLRRWPRSAGALGAVLYPAELVLTSLLREGPSTELVVCRKRPE